MPTYSVLFDPFHSLLDNVFTAFAETMEFYAEGTAVLQDVYTDSTGGTTLANPYTISAGRATVFGQDALGYKIILKNAAGATLVTVDNYFTTNTLTSTALLTSTDTSATSGPNFELYRNSASPADDDFIGKLLLTGQDDGANKTTYGEIAAQIKDVTDATEDSALIFRTQIAGTLTDIVTMGATVDVETDLWLIQGAEPFFYFWRNDATPGDGDDIGTIFWRGENSASTATNFAYITGSMLDVTDTTEDGEIQFHTRLAGTIAERMTLGAGLEIGAPTGGDKGAGTLNVDTAIYVDNDAVPTLGAINTFTTTQIISSTDTGSGGGPQMQLYRNSASPASSDGLGILSFYGENSADEKTLYSQLTTTIVDATDGSEDGRFDFYTIIAGSSGVRVKVGSGMQLGTPTGGDKGAGTLNAVAVYDDNVLLTDYVFDYSLDGKINAADLMQAQDFLSNTDVLNIDNFSKFWKDNRHLPTMPSREDFKKDRPPIGKLAQKLWETAEIQSVHIDNLNQRLKKLEAA